MTHLSPGAFYAWKIAGLEARAMGSDMIRQEHLFIGILSLEKVRVMDKKTKKKSPNPATKAEQDAIVRFLALAGHEPVVLRRLMREQLGRSGEKNESPAIHRDRRCRTCFDRAEYYAGEKPVRATDLFSAIMEQPGDLISAVLAEARRCRAADRDSDFILRTGTGFFSPDISRNGMPVPVEDACRDLELYSLDLDTWSPRSGEHRDVMGEILKWACRCAEFFQDQNDDKGLVLALRFLSRAAPDSSNEILSCIRECEAALAEGKPFPPDLKERIRTILRRIGGGDPGSGTGDSAGGTGP